MSISGERCIGKARGDGKAFSKGLGILNRELMDNKRRWRKEPAARVIKTSYSI